MQNRNNSKNDLEGAIIAITLAIISVGGVGLAAKYYSREMDKQPIEYEQSSNYKSLPYSR